VEEEMMIEGVDGVVVKMPPDVDITAQAQG
jgi:hypothetical protein